MKELRYLRHGESEDIRDKIRSRKDTPLTDKGRQQAKNAGIQIRESGWQPDVIISSPFPRTKDSARIVADEIDYPKEAIEFDPDIVERYWGTFTGKSHSEVKEIFERDGITVNDVEGAETDEKLEARAVKFYEKVEKRPEANLLVIGHGTFGRFFRRVINKQPLEDEYSEKIVTLKTGEILVFYPPQDK